MPGPWDIPLEHQQAAYRARALADLIAQGIPLDRAVQVQREAEAALRGPLAHGTAQKANLVEKQMRGWRPGRTDYGWFGQALYASHPQGQARGFAEPSWNKSGNKFLGYSADAVKRAVETGRSWVFTGSGLDAGLRVDTRELRRLYPFEGRRVQRWLREAARHRYRARRILKRTGMPKPVSAIDAYFWADAEGSEAIPVVRADQIDPAVRQHWDDARFRVWRTNQVLKRLYTEESLKEGLESRRYALGELQNSLAGRGITPPTAETMVEAAQGSTGLYEVETKARRPFVAMHRSGEAGAGQFAETLAQVTGRQAWPSEYWPGTKRGSRLITKLLKRLGYDSVVAMRGRGPTLRMSEAAIFDPKRMAKFTKQLPLAALLLMLAPLALGALGQGDE